MKWRVEFFSDNIMKRLNQWPPALLAQFLRTLNLIEKYGPFEVGMPKVKNMGKGLFEIRVKAHTGIGRAFFCLMQGQTIVILHGYIKKSEKAPKKELNLALDRMKEVRHEQKTKLQSV